LLLPLLHNCRLPDASLLVVFASAADPTATSFQFNIYMQIITMATDAGKLIDK
jgi:hypothetical protein